VFATWRCQRESRKNRANSSGFGLKGAWRAMFAPELSLQLDRHESAFQRRPVELRVIGAG
jgi:hypothetical protein